MIDPNGFLMIEPKELAHRLVLDSITRKATALLRRATADADRVFMGHHECICGARSDCLDWFVTIQGRKRPTNSLAVHYVAWHRDEIPPDQLRAIEALIQEVEPSAYELNGPSETGER
jgi:hypothetical protein